MALIGRPLDDTEVNRIHRLMPGVTVRIQTWEDSRTEVHKAFTYDHRTWRDSEGVGVAARTGQVAHIVGSQAGGYQIDAGRLQNMRPGRTPETNEGALASRYTDPVNSGPNSGRA